MAPGFETEEALKRAKAADTYWANRKGGKKNAA